MDGDVLVELVARAYEAGADATRWSAFLECLGDAIGDRTCALMVQDLASQTGSMASTYRVDPALEQLYAQHYAALNPWTSMGERHMETGRVIVGEMALSASALRRTEFYDGFLRPYDILHSLAAVIERSDEGTAFLAVQRSSRRGEFASEDLALVQQLVPHVQRALELHRRLGAKRQLGESLVEVAERMSWGVLLLDRTRRVVFANRAAARFGRALTAQVLARANRGGGIVLRDKGRPLSVRVSPLRAHRDVLGLEGPTHVVFVIDPEVKPALHEHVLREAYGLTAAEARLAIALARGETLTEVAETTRTTVGTQRTHLKRVLGKTGTGRQAELVRLVLLLSPPAIDTE